MAPLPHTEIWVVAMIAGEHSRWICQLIVHVSLHFHLGDLHFLAHTHQWNRSVCSENQAEQPGAHMAWSRLTINSAVSLAGRKLSVFYSTVALSSLGYSEFRSFRSREKHSFMLKLLLSLGSNVITHRWSALSTASFVAVCLKQLSLTSVYSFQLHKARLKPQPL